LILAIRSRMAKTKLTGDEASGDGTKRAKWIVTPATALVAITVNPILKSGLLILLGLTRRYRTRQYTPIAAIMNMTPIAQASAVITDP